MTENVKTVDQQVAERIRERRLTLGMTQQTLARLIGVAFQQAHKYERGLDRITAGRLYSIARALNTPISYFFPREVDDGSPRRRGDTRGKVNGNGGDHD